MKYTVHLRQDCDSYSRDFDHLIITLSSVSMCLLEAVKECTSCSVSQQTLLVSHALDPVGGGIDSF